MLLGYVHVCIYTLKIQRVSTLITRFYSHFKLYPVLFSLLYHLTYVLKHKLMNQK